MRSIGLPGCFDGKNQVNVLLMFSLCLAFDESRSSRSISPQPVVATVIVPIPELQAEFPDLRAHFLDLWVQFLDLKVHFLDLWAMRRLTFA
ncbi:MAG: hypothetical protein ACR2RA_18010, partial [Geminicoccaceae bacterium]